MKKKNEVAIVVRILAEDQAVWIEAANVEGISQAEFLRRSIRERGRKILRRGAREKRSAAIQQ